jgi:hypothetical protein
MLFEVNAFRFSLVNGGHELMSLALKLKYVAHRLEFLAQIIMSPAHRGDIGSSKDGADSSVGDVYSGN